MIEELCLWNKITSKTQNGLQELLPQNVKKLIAALRPWISTTKCQKKCSILISAFLA